MNDDELREILDEMDENEQFGLRAGLFPAWIQDYDLDSDDHARLIQLAPGDPIA